MVLKAGAAHRLFQQHSPLTWSPLAESSVLQHLSWMLVGASTYLENVHRDADEVDVVLTKPIKPSELERAIREAGYEQIGLTATSEMFMAMAARAQTRFTVMTPFLDQQGAEMLMALFERTRSQLERRLIIRRTSTGLPDGYVSVANQLRTAGVRVFDYRLEREGGGFETFHAKVVLEDRNCAYVGSTNMNQWSIAYSMELGVTLTGRAAGRIARVLEAVVNVARPVS